MRRKHPTHWRVLSSASFVFEREIEMNWIPHEVATNLIESLGMEWSVRSINADQINVIRSRQNRARMEPIDNQTVEDFACAMESGADFPKIVVAWSAKDKQYLICGGNHRHCAALMLGCETFDVIVVDCDDADIDPLCMLLNTVEGRRTPHKDRIEQAVILCRSGSMSIQDAAKRFQCNDSTINIHLRATDCDNLLGKLGVELPKQIPLTIRSKLFQFSNEEAVFVSVARYVSKCRPSLDQYNALRDLLTNEKSEKGRLEVIKRASPAKKVKSKFKHPVRKRLLSAFSGFEWSLDGKQTLKELQFNEDERKEMLDRWEQIKKRLDAILQNG